MEQSNKPSTKSQGQQPEPQGIRWTTLLWLLLAVVALIWLLPSIFGLGGSSNETVTYSAFLAQVSANNVQSLTITDYDVTGVFKAPVLSADGTTRSTQFTTTIPQFGNADLIALLQAHL